MQDSQKKFYKKILGGSGERQAKKYLKKKGFKIIKKNFGTKFAEADLIALDEDVLVFIEVKTRSNEDYGKPCEAVDFRKRKKYCMLAEYFRMSNREYRNSRVRFDVVEILDGEINHIEGAFFADDGEDS